MALRSTRVNLRCASSPQVHLLPPIINIKAQGLQYALTMGPTLRLRFYVGDNFEDPVSRHHGLAPDILKKKKKKEEGAVCLKRKKI